MADLNGGSRAGGKRIITEANTQIIFDSLTKMDMTGTLGIFNASKTKSIKIAAGDTDVAIDTTANSYKFNKPLYVTGEMYAGATANQKVLHRGNIGTETGISIDMVDGYNVDDTKGGTNTTTDNAIITANAVRARIAAMKNEILGGAGAAYDTLKELQDSLINDTTGLAAMMTKINSKLGKTEVAADSNKLDGLNSSDFSREYAWLMSGNKAANTNYKLFTITCNEAEFHLSSHLLSIACGDVFSGVFLINRNKNNVDIIPISYRGISITLGIDLLNSYSYAVYYKGSAAHILETRISIRAMDSLGQSQSISKTTSITAYTPAAANTQVIRVCNNTTALAQTDINNSFITEQRFCSSSTYTDPDPGPTYSIKASGSATNNSIAAGGLIKSNTTVKAMQSLNVADKVDIKYNTTSKCLDFNFL